MPAHAHRAFVDDHLFELKVFVKPKEPPANWGLGRAAAAAAAATARQQPIKLRDD